MDSEPIAKVDLYTNDLGDVDSEPSQTSDSYTVPGSSGTMKETHIFTPIKPNTSNDTSTLPSPSPSIPLQPSSSTLVSNGNTKTQRTDISLGDIDQFSNDTIVIKENVVKKEYRDVEYEPNKLMASDDFTEFQFAQPTLVSNNAIIESKTTVSNTTGPSTANLSNSIALSNSTSLPNSTNVSNYKLQQNSISDYLPDLSANKKEPDIISNDGYVNKQPKSESYLNSFENSAFQSLPSIDQATNKMTTLSNGNRSDYEFYSLNESFTTTSKNIPANGGGILNNDTNNFGCASDSMEIFSISSNDQKNSVSTTNNTSKQNVPIGNSLHSTAISSNLQTTNMNTTMMNSMNSNKFVSSSGILTPQTASSVQSHLKMMNNNASSIQWPEPGINSDQLEQFEKRFFSSPQQPIDPKSNEKINEQNTETNADDEWSDFVSVVQPQTPITNILNKNLLKHQQQNNDEDDWSEFVSSTPSNLHRFTSNSIASETNSNYESMFKSWNTSFPISSNSQQSNLGNFIVQPNALRPQQQQQPICTIESNAFQIAQQPIAPSIISVSKLPDLGFVAPKSLVNMPNISKAKK